MSFHFGSSLGLVFLFVLSPFPVLFLSFLHADALAFIFFGTSSFGLPRVLFFSLGTCPRVLHVLLSVLVSRLSPAPWLVSRRCSGSNGSAPMRLVGMSSFEGVACAHLCPITAIFSPLSRIAGRFVSQSSTWLLVGKAGWLASGTRGTLICQLR